MGFLSQIQLSRLRADVGGSTGTPADYEDFWYGSPVNASGEWVNADLALTLSAFWRGVRILSENIASFPCHVFERLPNGGRRVAEGHPVDDLVFRAPNQTTTAFEYWETSMAHLVLRGNAYSYIYPGPRGFVDSLELIHPDLVSVDKLPNRSLQYIIQTSKGRIVRGQEDIFHIRGLSFDGVTGVSVIRYAAQSIGAMLAAEKFAARFFTSGATAALAAIPEDDIGPDGAQNLRASILAYLTGLNNAFGVFVPPDKMELKTIGIHPQDSQLLQTRQFGLHHVAQWLNMSPAMLGDVATASYASSRQFRQDLVDLTFRPWVERIEAKIDAELFLNPDRFYSKFNMTALQRGDPKERADVDHIYTLDGVVTRNEVRLKNDLNPLPGLDDPLEPLNMTRSSERNEGGNGSRASIKFDRGALMTLQEANRLVRKEVAAATKASQRFSNDASGWQGWLREFYGDYEKEVAERLRIPMPVAREYAAKQGLTLAEKGISAVEDWEWLVPPQLAALAMNGHDEGVKEIQ